MWRRGSLNCHLGLIDGKGGSQNPPTRSRTRIKRIQPPKYILETGTFIPAVPKDSIYLPLQKHTCLDMYLL